MGPASRTTIAHMVVRQATEADLSAIREVGLITWPSTYGFAGEDYITHGLATWWSIESLRESLHNTETVISVDDDEAVIGVGNVDLRQSPPVIWKLYVRPDRHGRGTEPRCCKRWLGGPVTSRSAWNTWTATSGPPASTPAEVSSRSGETQRPDQTGRTRFGSSCRLAPSAIVSTPDRLRAIR